MADETASIPDLEITVRVRAEAEVKPTENPEKVTRAVTNIVSGNIQALETGKHRYLIQVEGNAVSSLENFRFILHRDRIRAAARAVLSRAVDNNRIIVFLNKQVAHAGHVSFCAPVGESPLGPIRLEIETGEPEQLIDWLAGRPDEWKREKT